MRFSPIALGQPIPNTPHAVSCSLPTMQDVIGYEEKAPQVLNALKSGYPRFVIHPFLALLREKYFTRQDRELRDYWFFGSEVVAWELVQRLGGLARVVEPRTGVWVVEHPRDPVLYQRSKEFLQMSGAILSSRQAEDLLIAEGVFSEPFPESVVADVGEAEKRVKSVLSRVHGNLPSDRILLTSNGMNAFRETFLTIAEKQKKAGRDLWIQFGWLYTDTMRILRDWADGDGKVEEIYDILQLKDLQAVLQRDGHRLAGLITEAPTNPLLQTADLLQVARLIRASGGIMIVDPTLASPYNINVCPVADVVINSLTKYAGNGGDVLAGSVVFPQPSPVFEWRDEIARRCQPLYHREMIRLAAEVENYEKIMPVMNANARALIDWLEKRPEVDRVYWTGSPSFASFYENLSCGRDRTGPVFSLTLKKSIAPFYDRLPLPKGPSFGMVNSLLCPFMYLAHYDLVSEKDGRAFLLRCGLPIDLLRISVGTEPLEDLIAAFEDAFKAYEQARG